MREKRNNHTVVSPPPGPSCFIEENCTREGSPFRFVLCNVSPSALLNVKDLSLATKAR